MNIVMHGIVALSAVVTAAYFVRSELRTPDDVVRARGISVVDDQGRERIWLGKPHGADMPADAVGLSILSPASDEAVWIGSYASETGGAVQLRDGAGRVRIRLITHGSPSVILSDENGADRIDVGFYDGTPVVRIRDEFGAVRASMSVRGGRAGGAELQLGHQLEEEEARVPLFQKGGIMLNTFDDGRAKIQIRGLDDKNVWESP